MAVLSDSELVELLLQTCYDLGRYSILSNPAQLYDMAPALKARDEMRADLLNRLAALREGAGVPEPEFCPEKVKEEVSARDALMALIPAIWRATERKSARSRAAAFALICRFNQVLRPYGYEYLMRPGNMIVLRRAGKRWTWADETR